MKSIAREERIKFYMSLRGGRSSPDEAILTYEEIASGGRERPRNDEVD